MTNQEILEKAIQKAIDGGFNKNEMEQDIKTVEDVYYYFDDGHGTLDVNRLIWRHDFAKALWGDKYVYRADCIESPENGAAGFQEYYTAWEFHLREMVIADDPIKYLGENI